MVFATRGKKHRRYRGFGLPRHKKQRSLRCFLLRESQKMRKHQLFDDFRPLRDREKSCRGNNNNNNNSTVVFDQWGAKLCGVFCPEGFLKIGLTQPKWPLVGPCTHHRHHQQCNDSKHLSLDSFVSLFSAILLWWRILHRYASTNRRRYIRTETFAQSSFYAQILFHKVCAQITFYTQTPLHTEVFTQRSLPTEVFIHRCFAQRCIYTHK